MNKITFITGNVAKAEILSKLLKRDVNHKKLDFEEIQSLDLEKIVTRKAKDTYEILKSPVLVEDASLKFNVLGNLPGPLIKWFYEELGNKGLCRLLNHYKKDRSAVAEIAFCLYDGKESKIFRSKVEGRISAHPRGDGGFGWDPVFIPEGHDKTWAEMSGEDQGSSGVRKFSIDELSEYLNKNWPE